MTTDPAPFVSALPPLTTRHRTIAFTSGKGGVGKSNLVLNTGLLLARRGRRVVILDGDFGLSSLHVLLGLSPRHDLRHVLAGERRLAEILLPGPWGLRIIPAGSGVAELANLDDDRRSVLLGDLEAVAAGVDFLLIDTGAGISDAVLHLIAASDETVVVTRPEPTALADAYALMKVIVTQEPAYPFHLLINMVRDRDQGKQVYDSLSEILMKFLGYRPGYAGHVVADPRVAQAVVDQVPFTIGSPRTAATRCLESLTDTVLGTPAPVGDGMTFWEKVTRWTRKQG